MHTSLQHAEIPKIQSISFPIIYMNGFEVAAPAPLLFVVAIIQSVEMYCFKMSDERFERELMSSLS